MSRFPRAQFLLSAAAPAQFPADEGTEIAFAGRSNAGKSSALNALTGRRSLARTGKTPGLTRLVNFFMLQEGVRLVDLPGYGYADAPEAERRRWLPLLEALRRRESLRGLFLIVDARRGVSEGDEQLIAWADPQRRRVHVLLNKADKLSASEARRALAAAGQALAGRATVQLFSARSGAGLPEAQRLLVAMAQKNPDDLRRDHRGD